MLSLHLFYILLCTMAHLMSNIRHYRLKWMSLSGLVRGRQISWHFSDEGMFYSPPPPASKCASIQCAIYCLIWLPPLQHVCPGRGKLVTKALHAFHAFLIQPLISVWWSWTLIQSAILKADRACCFEVLPACCQRNIPASLITYLKKTTSLLVIMRGRDDFGGIRELFS